MWVVSVSLMHQSHLFITNYLLESETSGPSTAMNEFSSEQVIRTYITG